jgi:hypothetical protein
MNSLVGLAIRISLMLMLGYVAFFINLSDKFYIFTWNWDRGNGYYNYMRYVNFKYNA